MTKPNHAMEVALQGLKNRQSLHLPIKHHKPFLTEPANFGSVRTAEELAARQAGQIIKVPPPKRTPVMNIAEVIGTQQAQDIEDSGQFVFHAAGDTGAGAHQDLPEVVEVMAMDFQRPNPADRPAFFLHLGDVTYNLRFGDVESKRGLYEPQFYSPYAVYPAKILAIPGNHDSNPQEDPKSIDVFEENFCADPPMTDAQLNALVNAPRRTPMYQPGVYYRLDAPFVQILCLFSNGGETEGVIKGALAGNDQYNFLVAQLKDIKAARANGPRKALLLAVHHPPYSGGGHGGSTTMLKDLESAFTEAGLAPDVFLSGHSHNYQRFTRHFAFQGKTMEVPYLVVGCGGHNIEPVKPGPDRRPVRTPLHGGAPGAGPSDHSLRQYFNGFGHVLVTATKKIVTIDLIGTHTQSAEAVDSVTVDLASNTITAEKPPLAHPAIGEQHAAVTR